jgi:hypothetical protein
MRYELLFETATMIYCMVFPHTREGLDDAFRIVESYGREIECAEISSSRDGEIWKID